MRASRTRKLFQSFVLVSMLGMSSGISANNCNFAYQFCMPIYYACMADGNPQADCIAMLDQCILNNGCGNLP